MIVRVWLVTGMLLIGISWYLTVAISPANHQGSARSAIDSYREAGLMPAAGSLPMSKEIGHEVFEIPKTDAEHLGDKPMAGMDHGNMPGMDMKQMPGMDHANMPGMTDKKMPAMDHANMPGMTDKKMPAMDHANMPGMTDKKMPAMDHANMPGMAEKKMPAMDHANMPGMAEERGHGGESEKAEGGHSGRGGGLVIFKSRSVHKIDRTVEIKMSEWGYKPGNIIVKQGQVIRLVVTNAGNTPHEFMLMTGPAMNAVGYRVNRADWNLTEHDAIYEKPLILPGDRFELVLKIEKPGMWMFMCMFPYHMALGMMGSLMTEGMQGMSMGGMKM